MDGGTCEASVAMAYGLKTVGISIPLGNYHNQNFEGGPDSTGKPGPEGGPAPEHVHFRDIQGMLSLCRALLTPHLSWNSPWQSTIKKYRASFKEYAKLLKAP